MPNSYSHCALHPRMLRWERGKINHRPTSTTCTLSRTCSHLYLSFLSCIHHWTQWTIPRIQWSNPMTLRPLSTLCPLNLVYRHQYAKDLVRLKLPQAPVSIAINGFHLWLLQSSVQLPSPLYYRAFARYGHHYDHVTYMLPVVSSSWWLPRIDAMTPVSAPMVRHQCKLLRLFVLLWPFSVKYFFSVKQTQPNRSSFGWWRAFIINLPAPYELGCDSRLLNRSHQSPRSTFRILQTTQSRTATYNLQPLWKHLHIIIK